MLNLTTTLTLTEAVARFDQAVLASGRSVERIDSHLWQQQAGSVATLVYDKYFLRSSGRASLAVTVTDLAGCTEVRAVGSGGGQTAFSGFDNGVAEAFEQIVWQALGDTVTEINAPQGPVIPPYTS